MKAVRAWATASLLLLIVAGVFVPSLPGHAHGEFLVPASWARDNPPPFRIDVTVAVDEEWLETFGPDAERQARHVVAIAAANLRPTPIRLTLSEVTTWTSADDADSIHPLLEDLERSHPHGDAALVLGLTAGNRRDDADGVARIGRPYVVVRHHRGRLDRDAYVLTHEIGHVLGLHHHSCEDHLCFMADHGYDPREHWCEEHLQVLRGNAGYFQYLAEVEPQA